MIGNVNDDIIKCEILLKNNSGKSSFSNTELAKKKKKNPKLWNFSRNRFKYRISITIFLVSKLNMNWKISSRIHVCLLKFNLPKCRKQIFNNESRN